ncbi:MAG: hypothetical protein ACOY4K_00145 [Pseudomonadota bacterium]
MAASIGARARQAAIVAASLAFHGLALVLLGLTQPRLREVFLSDPEAVQVELLRPEPAEAASHRARAAAPPPSPVAPRQVAPDAPPARVAPLPLAPAPPAGADADGGTGARPHPAPYPARDRGALKRALRGSAVGCGNRDAVGLTLREREACDEAMGAGAAQARFIDPPIDPAKRRGFDATAARKAEARRRKEAPVPPGIDPTDNAGGTKTTGIGILDD